jgi:hypothetical protein
MKVFNVDGSNWNNLVEINDDLYEKYGDMAMEAMTQSFDAFIKGDLEAEKSGDGDLELGLIMGCYEKGFKGVPDKEIICLSYIVAENAGYPEMAKAMRREIDKIQSQIRDDTK